MESKIVKVGWNGEIDSLDDLQCGNILLFDTFKSKSLITEFNEDNTFQAIGRRSMWGKKWINEFKFHITDEEGNYKVKTSIRDRNRIYYSNKSYHREKYTELDEQLIEAGL